MPKTTPLSLDGSTLEGGGQLVRVAFCLSAITGIPVNVFNIRANRMSKSRSRNLARIRGRGGKGGRLEPGKSTDGTDVAAGAKESHLAAVMWLAGECDAVVEGGEVGSGDILFIPGATGIGGKFKEKDRKDAGKCSVRRENNLISLERPGSVCLILQCLLPYLLFGPWKSPTMIEEVARNGVAQEAMELTLRGGTNVSKAMSVDYVQEVFFPMLRRLAGESLPEVQLDTVQRGWAGGASQIGEVKIRVQRPVGTSLRLENFNAIERGNIEKISIVVVAEGSQIRKDVFNRLHDEIAAVLGCEIPIEPLTDEESGDVRWLYVLLIAHTSNGFRLGSDFLGSGRKPKNAVEQRKIVEEAVKTVVRRLSREIKRGGCVDEHMQDQLVVFQALSRGEGMVNGGSYKEDSGAVEVVVGDDDGSLHTQTVRWVCEIILTRKALKGRKPGVVFSQGGRCTGVGWNWSSEDTDIKFDERSIKDEMAQLSIREA